MCSISRRVDGLPLVSGLHLGCGARLVDDVDRLVGQEAVVDVLGGQLGGRAQRLVGVGDVVMLLVLRLEPAEDLVRLLDARLDQLDLLEAAGERAVALEVLLEVLERRRADAAQLAAGERGLQQVRGVHGAAVGRAGADHGVDLVDEQHGAGLLLEGAEHRLEAGLELAAELRAGEQRAHVEGVDLDVLQAGRDLLAMDAQRQSLDDGGLADPGIADEDGVVLAAPAEHVHGALELALAADERVDAAGGRLLDQVDGEGGEGIARGRRVVVVAAAGVAVGRRRLGRRLRDAVRQVGDDVESGDALLREQEGGVRIGLPEDRGQQVGAVDLLTSGRLHVRRRALEDALEAERLLRRALVTRVERILLVEVGAPAPGGAA